MKTLPTQPISLFQLIKTSIIAYFKILPQIIGLVVLSSLGHFVIPPLYLQDPAFAAIAFVGFVLLTWFLYTAIICRARICLLGGHIDFTHAFRLAKQRYLSVLGSNVIFFAIGALLILIQFALSLLLHPNLYFVLSAIINIVIFVFLYFAIPEIALEHSPILKSFKKSVRLVRHHWWRTFIILALVGAAILGCEALGILFTGKSRMFLFTGYHFLLQVVFYPLIIAVTILLLNDLELRNPKYSRHPGT